MPFNPVGAVTGAISGAFGGGGGGGGGGGLDFADALAQLKATNQEAIANSIEVSIEQTESKTAVDAAKAARVA